MNPLAEKYSSLSAYNYAVNNPISVIDPDGRDVKSILGGETYTGQDEQIVFGMLKAMYRGNDGDDDPQKKDESPKFPDWLRKASDTPFGKFIQFLGQRDVQNMWHALDVMDREGTQGYFNINISNAHREIAFDFGVGGYGPFSTKGFGSSIRGAAKTGANVVEQVTVHGNSLKSLKPTWGYKLYSQDGTFLKNGITSKLVPESRYTRAFMLDKKMVPIKQFPNRLEAWKWEFGQNQILRGPLNKNMH